MRNLTYFLAVFLVICLIGLTTACSMPLRKPEPYEQRTQKKAQSDLQSWEDQKRAEHAAWWTCTYRHRTDEC